LDFEQRLAVTFGDQQFLLIGRPTPSFLDKRRVWPSWLVLIGGLLLTFLLRMYLRDMIYRAERISELVQKRTAELENANTRLRAEVEERERAEAQLAHEQYLVNALMDTIPDMVYFKDLQSRFLRINRALASRFKLADPVVAVGKTDFDFYTAEHAQAAFADEQEIIRTGLPLVGREEKETWPDGSVTWASTTKQALRDQHGNITGTFGISRDITARKAAEQALATKNEELLRSNRELEQFAYVASHDLQEPLRMVASYTQLLGRRYAGKLDAEADEFIGYAVGGAKRMQALINDLLTYSRVGTQGKPFAWTELQHVVKLALNNLHVAITEIGARIHVGSLPRVMGDETQLVQLYQNLISNALKFRGPKPPEIALESNLRPGPPAEWVMSVRDNGIGIEARHFERIFVIFQRLHGREDYPGTGIGLAVCKKVVERHGGRIWVESQPGQGSTFFFALPQVDKG
jgi:PAS domain S-box-containing protein